MTYVVSTVSRDEGDRIITSRIGAFADKGEAMKIAKRAAHTRKDCITYGPSSLAYVGSELTAVVAW
jgi:hypothetical protein